MEHKGGPVREAEEDILVGLRKKSKLNCFGQNCPGMIDNVIINDPAAEIT